MSVADGVQTPLDEGVEPLRAPSLVELSYGRLRDLILNGSLDAGTRLNEVNLSERLGVSRGTLRVAIRRLADEGLVDERPRQGAFVKLFEPREIIDIYNLRVGIEVTAARLAVRRQADLRPLRAILDSFHEAATHGDLAEAMRLEFDFHYELCALSGNGQLLQVYRALQGRVRAALSYDNRANEDLRELPQRHEAILDALGTGDERVAARAVGAHIVGHVDRVLEQVGADPDDLLPPLE
jgi:DNA-binding GntR family transcriptional regulator